MARVDYDAWEGFTRLAVVLHGFDRRAAEIVGCHTALEREVVVVLERLLPRSGYVSDFSYRHKVSMLAATWKGPDDEATLVEDVLSKYGTLRNRVAHGNDTRIDGAWRDLVTAYRRLQPDADAELTPLLIAQGILAFFGDGPTPEDVRRMQEHLDQIEASLTANGVESLPISDDIVRP